MCILAFCRSEVLVTSAVEYWHTGEVRERHSWGPITGLGDTVADNELKLEGRQVAAVWGRETPGRKCKGSRLSPEDDLNPFFEAQLKYPYLHGPLLYSFQLELKFVPHKQYLLKCAYHGLNFSALVNISFPLSEFRVTWKRAILHALVSYLA